MIYMIFLVPAYIIARVDVTDWDRYREYTKATPAAIAHFGGRFIVRGGEMLTLEGPEEMRRLRGTLTETRFTLAPKANW